MSIAVMLVTVAVVEVVAEEGRQTRTPVAAEVVVQVHTWRAEFMQ